MFICYAQSVDMDKLLIFSFSGNMSVRVRFRDSARVMG